MRDYLALDAPDLVERIAVTHYEDLPARPTLPSGTWIFSALDQLTTGGLRLALELAEQLRRSGPETRVVNSPSTTLLRLALLEELHRQGLNRHRAVRANGELRGLRYPVFLREEHQHSGALSPLIGSPAELEREMGRAILRGYPLRDLLVVEFCDTRCPDGFYRKYPVFVVGREIIPRGLTRGEEWMVKLGSGQWTEAHLLEERAFVLGNPHQEMLRRIIEAAGGIEYGRIDYSVQDARVITWEINLNPTIGLRPGERISNLPESLEPMRRIARDHFYGKFKAALLALDAEFPAREIAVRYSAECLKGLGPMIRSGHRAGALAPVARMLRPVMPLLNRLAGMISPLLVRAARRMQ